MKRFFISVCFVMFACIFCLAQVPDNPETKKSKLSINDIYARSTLSLSQARSTFLERPGISLSQSIGYKFNSRFHAGIGISREHYFFNYYGGMQFIGLFTEASFFLKPNGVSPYGTFRLGAGFGLNQYNRSSSSTPGVHMNPELGLRFPIWSFDFTLGIGVKIQNLTYRFNEQDEFNRYTEKYKIRRPELRLGLLF